MIAITGPHTALDEGYCLGCVRQIDRSEGRLAPLSPDATVYLVRVRKSEDVGGATIQLCAGCLTDLAYELEAFQPRSN